MTFGSLHDSLLHCEGAPQRTQRAFWFLFFLLIIPSCPPVASAADYTFTNVSSPATGTPSINNSGTVAFITTLDTGERRILTWNAGVITTIAASDGSPFRTIGTTAMINDAGQVVFQARKSGSGLGIFVGDGGPTRTVILSKSMGGYLFDGPSINSAGVVGFFANFLGNGGGVYSIDHGFLTEIYRRYDKRFPQFKFCTINSSGAIAYTPLSRGGGPPHRILIGDGQSQITVVRRYNNGDTYIGFHAVTINDAGKVAFIASVLYPDMDHSQLGVFVADGDTVTPIAFANYGTIGNYGAPFFSLTSVSINSDGKVAFSARPPDNYNDGIFTGSDPIGDKVIGPQDALFGSTVWSVGLGSRALNDAGQIAFSYGLADGRSGVAVATPLP